MEEIPSDTQKSTIVLSTPVLSKDVVPSHYADIELSHRGGTYMYDPIQNKRNQVVYSTVISVEVCYITHFTNNLSSVWQLINYIIIKYYLYFIFINYNK